MGSIEVTLVTLQDEDLKPMESARNDEIVWLPVPEGVREGDIIRKKISSQVQVSA